MMNNWNKIAIGLSGKRILITGATGFVGKNICEKLIELNEKNKLGMKITGLARKKVMVKGMTFHSHDVLLPFNLNETFDFIIHAATPVTHSDESPEEILNIIVKGTHNALQFAKKSKATHFLLVSSGAIYGQIPESLKSIPETFTSTQVLTSAYGEGKRQSELMAHEFLKQNKIILNIARCFAFSGKHLPLDAHFAIGNFVRDALAGGPIIVKGDGSAVRSYMDAEDMVYWLLTILLHDKSDIFNVGSDLGVSIKELAHEVASQVVGVDVIIEGKASEEVSKNVYVPKIEKASEVLDLKLNVSREASIKRMLKNK